MRTYLTKYYQICIMKHCIFLKIKRQSRFISARNLILVLRAFSRTFKSHAQIHQDSDAKICTYIRYANKYSYRHNVRIHICMMNFTGTKQSPLRNKVQTNCIQSEWGMVKSMVK